MNCITPAEEQQVLGMLEAMEFHTITMHGQTARRTVRHFGLDYGYESWKLVPTDPLPSDLAWLQERAAVLAGLDPEEGDARQVAEVTLDPRSAYVLAGAARFAWQHSIPPTRALRYSITFRTLKAPQPPAPT